MSIIVVTARVASGGGFPASTTYVSSTSTSAVEAYGGEFTPDNQAQTGMEIRINVNISNAANQAQAEQAAKNVADALAKIIAEASKLPRNTPLPLPGGKTITAGELVDLAKGVKFVITDVPPANPGVGAADRTNMTDTLLASAFAGPGSYADPNLQGQGMIGGMLHELVHLSLNGYANLSTEYAKFNFESTHHPIDSDFPWENSGYFNDNESFATNGAISAGTSLGFGMTIYDSWMNAPDFMGAQGVYDAHKEERGWDK